MASDLTADAGAKSRQPARRPIRLWMVLLALGDRLDPRRRCADRGTDHRRVPARRRRLDGAQALEERQHATGRGSCARQPPSHRPVGTSSATDYALVDFGAPAQYHYAAVAGNGTWALLNSRSMVHYAGTRIQARRGT